MFSQTLTQSVPGIELLLMKGVIRWYLTLNALLKSVCARYLAHSALGGHALNDIMDVTIPVVTNSSLSVCFLFSFSVSSSIDSKFLFSLSSAFLFWVSRL